MKRDFDALESRRLEAGKMLRQGIHEAEVARQVGVHRQSVNRWSKVLAEQGLRGLRKAGRAGRRPRLTNKHLRRIERCLKRGPEAYGHVAGLWTLDLVAELIKKECGIQYHPGHVWRVLRDMEWSCQRPTGCAIERNEAAIRRWKSKRWPILKKKPRQKAGQSSSLMKAD